MKEHNYYTYIMTNERNTVLYIGVTGNLVKRIWEHKNKVNPLSFTARYNVGKLVYFAHSTQIYDAIAYEKQLKGGSRQKKIKLIEESNPKWKDLSEEIGLGLEESALSLRGTEGF